MTTMTTPDQPTGMNELREILWQLYNVRFPKPVTDEVPKAEAAVQEIVERCLPVVRTLPDADASNWAKGVHQGHCEATDQFRHNLQQAGLLSGDETGRDV